MSESPSEPSEPADSPAGDEAPATGAETGALSARTQVAAALEPDFEVIRSLGETRTSQVFLAREPALRRLVSIKVLRPDVGESETARARFEREAHSMAGISHPNVPNVYRIGRLDAGLPYIVQEFVEGRSLRDRLEASGVVAADRARAILADVAAALSASHAKGVIHRDVRPEAIFIENESGKAYLTDFGLVAVRASGDGSNPRLTQTGELIGDPQYMSPEQLRGDPVTTAADVYSLGVLGYEILTLENPFGATTRQALFTAQISEEPRKLPWAVTGTDAELGDVLARCLRKEPSHRPRADDVRKSLAPGAGKPGDAAGGPPGGILAPFPKLAAFVAELRRRQVYQVGAAYAVVAFIVLQVAALLLVGFPSLYRMVVAVVVGGFPIALVLAWVYERTASGEIQRTKSVDGGPSPVWKVIGLILGVAVAGLAGWLFLR